MVQNFRISSQQQQGRRDFFRLCIIHMLLVNAGGHLIWPAYQYACMERRTEGKELLHLVSIMQWTPKEASIWN